MSAKEIVQAAGGVISRRRGRGQVEVLLVHRPHREDWTFPKGKVDPGESHEACALREVEEETGLHCALGPELPSTTYTDGKGRGKIVRYWIMEITGGVAEARNEVDAVRWEPIESAYDVLTYKQDRGLLAVFAATIQDVARRR